MGKLLKCDKCQVHVPLMMASARPSRDAHGHVRPTAAAHCAPVKEYFGAVLHGALPGQLQDSPGGATSWELGPHGYCCSFS